MTWWMASQLKCSVLTMPREHCRNNLISWLMVSNFFFCVCVCKTKNNLKMNHCINISWIYGKWLIHLTLANIPNFAWIIACFRYYILLIAEIRNFTRAVVHVCFVGTYYSSKETFWLTEVHSSRWEGISTYFSYFSMKPCVVCTHQKHLCEVLVMSTHNSIISWRNKKISLLCR